MSDKDISEALAIHLQALSYDVAYENKPFTPENKKIYLAEAFLPAETREVGQETGSTEHYRGVYQVAVMAPKGQSKLPGREAVEAVKAQFSRGTELTRNGHTVRVLRVRQSPAVNQGDRWMLPVSISYSSLIK